MQWVVSWGMTRLAELRAAGRIGTETTPCQPNSEKRTAEANHHQKTAVGTEPTSQAICASTQCKLDGLFWGLEGGARQRLLRRGSATPPPHPDLSQPLQYPTVSRGFNTVVFYAAPSWA